MRDFFANTLDLLAGGGAAIAGFLHGMTNGQGRTAILLAALMGADYVSGVLAASLGRSRKTAHGRLSSQAGWKGLLRKAVILLVVGLSVCVAEDTVLSVHVSTWRIRYRASLLTV